MNQNPQDQARFIDGLSDLPMPPGAVPGGAHAEPALPPQLPASGFELPPAKAVPYPSYSDPFEGVIRRIARKIPGLLSVVFDQELETRPDSREPFSISELGLHPCTAVCRIFARYARTNEWRQGSGFLVGPGLVATAAHVLHHETLGTAVEIWVSPGWHQGSHHKYIAGPSDWRVCQRWPGRWASEWDYGVVLLDPNATANHGQIDVLSLPDASWDDLKQRRARLTVTGYPTDKEASGTQWRGDGRIVAQEGLVIRHVCDTEEGESGAPVLGRFGGRMYAIGVHSKGFPNLYNVARKLNEDFRGDLARWSASR